MYQLIWVTTKKPKNDDDEKEDNLKNKKKEIMNDGMFGRWQPNYNNRVNDNQGSQCSKSKPSKRQRQDLNACLRPMTNNTRERKKEET